ncbi:MAG: VWA domain-containing protein [Gammaproteobacteria bacterium]
MAKPKRKTTVFSLSFLDIMSCGFGAVVLLFMIINHATQETNDTTNVDMISEVNLMEKRLELAKRNLFEIRNTVQEVDERQEELKGQVQEVIQILDDKEQELAALDETTVAQKEAIAKLKADVQSLDDENRRLEGSQASQEDTGDDLRSITGDGDRLYLTGLKLGGERVLVLVDASASMLDETIVNIIRRRNMSDAAKRKSAKWLRALGSVDWLISKLPKDVEFQIYTFNQRAQPTTEGSEGTWLSTGDPAAVETAMVGLNQVVPANGTSLHRAFDIVSAMKPAPDNIYLLTDGLPTMGENPPLRKTASGQVRKRHFERAVNRLIPGIPVNVILFPMEGDPDAAPSFWRLAQVTAGSFISPARDWP